MLTTRLRQNTGMKTLGPATDQGNTVPLVAAEHSTGLSAMPLGYSL